MTRLLPVLVLIFSAAVLARGSDEDLVWVVVHGDRGASMHGDMRDLKAARKYLSDQELIEASLKNGSAKQMN